MRYLADDALLGLLFPFWQLVIAVCLVGVSVVAAHKLLMRGPSRMSRAIVMTGGAVIGVLVISILVSMA